MTFDVLWTTTFAPKQFEQVVLFASNPSKKNTSELPELNKLQKPNAFVDTLTYISQDYFVSEFHERSGFWYVRLVCIVSMSAGHPEGFFHQTGQSWIDSGHIGVAAYLSLLDLATLLSSHFPCAT
jgi:hypothetical protein